MNVCTISAILRLVECEDSRQPNPLFKLLVVGMTLGILCKVCNRVQST